MIRQNALTAKLVSRGAGAGPGDSLQPQPTQQRLETSFCTKRKWRSTNRKLTAVPKSVSAVNAPQQRRSQKMTGS
jgi:hypothetical protein